MAGALPDNDDEKPLDPAAERVRRKLVRFMAINLGILFLALMAVVAALVYKSMTVPPETPAVASDIPSANVTSERILLPAGARLVSQSLSGNLLSLHVSQAQGGEAILIYDTGQGRIVARHELASE